MWPLRTFCCIELLFRSFLSQITKIWSVDLWKLFLANITFCAHFRSYVASSVEYKRGHCEHFPPQACFLGPSETKIQAIRGEHMKKQWYFSQNQKGFGCIGAAVLLILSPKELIWQKTRQSTLAITATILLKTIMAGMVKTVKFQFWIDLIELGIISDKYNQINKKLGIISD